MRQTIPATGGGRRLPPLRLGTKLGFAAGSLLDGIGQQAVNIFLFFYVTAVCGVPAALAGLALGAGLVVDAIVDPLIGSLSDNSHSKLGRRAPFMLLGLPGVMLFLVLIFSLPAGLTGTAQFVWLTFLSIGLRVSISLFLLPTAAVGAELSDDYRERSSIAAWRWGFAMLGALIAILLGFGYFLAGPGGLSNRAAYTPFAITLALVAAAGAIVSIRAVLKTRDRQFTAPVTEGAAHTRLFAELGEVFRNPSFRVLFGGALLLFTSLAIHSTLGLHANNYFWHLTPGQIQSVTLALFGGLLCGAPLAGPLLKLLEKRTVLLIGMVGLAVAYTVPPSLRLLGLLPLTGGSLVMVLAATVFIGGMLMAAAAIAFASMMADAADEHEYLFGARREGLYFAGWAFASKAAGGFGSLLAGVALQLIGFPSGGAASTARVSPELSAWIGAVYGPGSGLLAFLAAGVCLLYRLDSRAHAAIQVELDRKRETEVAATAPLSA